MSTNNNPNIQSANPADWSAFYDDLQNRGSVPDASSTIITQNYAVFRDMYLDLSEIKESIRKSGFTPVMTTIYADVLNIPDLTNWLLQSAGMVIFARRIEVSGNASVLLNYQQSTSAQLVLFASEMVGTLSVKAVLNSKDQPTLFTISQANVMPGITINDKMGTPTAQGLTLQQGLGFQLAQDMLLYLNNAFIFASLLYDQNPPLAISIFLWVKGWASQNSELEELFYRSTSLATLLSSEVNAQANGAAFVPYLTAEVYTDLSKAFADEAAKYESDYMELSTQKLLTQENIDMANTMVANSQSEIAYINALLEQANENYNNAEAAAQKANYNFKIQQMAVDGVAAQFEQIGIPAYERQQIIKAVFTLVTSVVTFGVAIALMAVGDEAAAPAAAQGAVASVEAVATTAKTGSETAKLAKQLADTMKQLKKLIEVLKKVYELAKAVKEVASEISSAKDQMEVIQKMDDTTQGVDLTAADSWAIFRIQADNAMQDPIDLGIEYAKEYKEALDILAVYGQSLSAAQLAVITAGQQAAAITFQLHYAEQKQENLQKLVDGLKVDEAPILQMMQQFYQKYLDAKSSLFAALKSYQDSYFYWALRRSSVQPKIIDPVTDLNSGIQNITRMAMDRTNALNLFDPPPQEMGNMIFEITDPTILKQLQTTGKASWVLPLGDQEFIGLERVRLSNIRVWIEGASFKSDNNSLFMTITTAGNYLDRYRNTNYQFNSKQLTRTFKYTGQNQGTGSDPDWFFDNGSMGFVQIDGTVDKEVAYAYFEPTPFSEWSINLTSNNPSLDYSAITKISMYFEGTAIGATPEARQVLQSKTLHYA